MNKDAVLKLIGFWRQIALQPNLHARDIVDSIDLKTKEIIDIIGPRRSGKSSILKLLIQKIQNEGEWIYLNFEDPFFSSNNKPSDVENIINTYQASVNKDLKYLFFDEVQNIFEWERLVRKYRDAEKYKIFITGSSSKLLSGELATLLTGRHLSYIVSPLSFSEYLQFKNIKVETEMDIASNGDKLLNTFDKYLKYGGFPEVALNEDLNLLKNYYLDIVQKDIFNRYDVRDRETVEKMGVFLATNIANTVTIASLKKQYEISYETASLYLSYFKESLLFYNLPQFAYSLKFRQKAAQKIFFVDSGLAQAISLSYSQDFGRVLENTVFSELRRRNGEIYYFKGNNTETDFVVKNKDESLELVQVCWQIEDLKTKTREFKGLQEAMLKLKTNNAVLLTHEFEDEVELNGKKIEILPAWKWMLRPLIKKTK